MKDFSNVADLLPEPMVVVDLQSGSLLGVNATAKRILDLQRGSEWLTRVQDVDALMAFLSEARRVRQMLPGSLVIKSQAELSRHRIRAAHMDRSSPAKVLIRIGPSEMDRRLKTLNTRLAIRVILPAGVGTFPEQAPEPPRQSIGEYHWQDHRGLLLDMTMPRVSGEQVFKEPQVLDPTLRTVLSSGYSEAEIRAQLAGRQPTASRGKPWTPSELLEVFTKMAEPDSQGCEAAKSSSSRARSSTHSSE